MSKYDVLWQWIKNSGEENIILSFDDVQKFSGVPVDHSFLNYKKELTEYGYVVSEISIKKSTVLVKKII